MDDIEYVTQTETVKKEILRNVPSANTGTRTLISGYLLVQMLSIISPRVMGYTIFALQ
jgi:hypothetical protein